MIIKGPTPITVAAPATAVQATIRYAQCDLIAKKVAVRVGARMVAVNMSAATLSALEADIKAGVETDQGWAAGSSQVTP